MATFNGLVRFDGVRFTVFDRGNSPGIRGNRFIALYEAADGAIWAGTDGGGVRRYVRGVFTTFTTQDGLISDHVIGITGDAAGHVWVLSGRQIMQWEGAPPVTVSTVPSTPTGCMSGPNVCVIVIGAALAALFTPSTSRGPRRTGRTVRRRR